MVRTWSALGVAFALLLAGAVWNVLGFNRRSAILKMYEPEVVALPRPEYAKELSLGFSSVIADLYWIGAVHYLGEARYQPYNYSQLIEYIDIITTLAPDLREAYWFGGVAAPWNTGTRWVNVEGAVRTLENGLKRFPDDWRMRMVLAYDYSAYQHRFKDAGDQLRRAAETPGAPRYLASLATRMYVSAGDVNGATDVAEQIYSATDDEDIKKAMKQRVQELRALRDVDDLQRAVNGYRAKHGAAPGQLSDLVADGWLRAIPEDPMGGSYLYNSQTGEVRSAHLNQPLGAFGIK